MSAWLRPIQDGFGGLQQREKQFVAVGAVILLVGLVYLALLPIWDRYHQLADQRDQLQTDLLWLQQQRAVVARLANSCAVGSRQTGAGEEILTRLVRRNQLRLDKIRQVERGFSLGLHGSDANRIMRLAHQVACEGFVVQSLRIDSDASEQKGLVVTMEVQSVDR